MMGKKRLTTNTWNGGSYRKSTRLIPDHDLSEVPAEPSHQERYVLLLAERDRKLTKAEQKLRKYQEHRWSVSGLETPENIRARYAPILDFYRPTSSAPVPAVPVESENVGITYRVSPASQYIGEQRTELAARRTAVEGLERTLTEKRAELESAVSTSARLEAEYTRFQALYAISDAELVLTSCNTRLADADRELLGSLPGGLQRSTTTEQYYQDVFGFGEI